MLNVDREEKGVITDGTSAELQVFSYCHGGKVMISSSPSSYIQSLYVVIRRNLKRKLKIIKDDSTTD